MIDKELRLILSEAMFEDFTTGHSRFNEEKTEEMVKVIISQIKALVVESLEEGLGEEEILEILNGRVRVGRGITEQLTAPIWTLRLYAKAIIAKMKKRWGG